MLSSMTDLNVAVNVGARRAVAHVHVARLVLAAMVGAVLAAELRRGVGAGARAEGVAAVARLGARAPGGELGPATVDRARGDVAGARLLVVRARLAAELGLSLLA